MLMVAALLWLLASWWPAVTPGNAWTVSRPVALFLLGAGALLMWLQTPRVVQRRPPRGFELSAFKHSTMADDLGPDTHPVGPPTSAFVDADAGVDAPTHAPAAAAANAGPKILKKPSRWGAGVLRAIEWQRFEAVCAALFRQDGYIARPHSSGTAQGTLLRLHSLADTKKPVRIVLCKHASDAPIGTATVSEFQQELKNAGVSSGAIVTAGRFSDEAKKLARANHIAPVDSVNLLTVILRRSESQQLELLSVATQGEYWRPTCPACNAKMSLRSGVQGKWACTGTPTCPGTLRWIPEAI